MEKVSEFKCTEEQYIVLARNKYKHLCIDENHYRIRPIAADISVIPRGDVNYRTQIERLEQPSNQWGKLIQMLARS